MKYNLKTFVPAAIATVLLLLAACADDEQGYSRFPNTDEDDNRVDFVVTKSTVGDGDNDLVTRFTTDTEIGVAVEGYPEWSNVRYRYALGTDGVEKFVPAEKGQGIYYAQKEDAALKECNYVAYYPYSENVAAYDNPAILEDQYKERNHYLSDVLVAKGKLKETMEFSHCMTKVLFDVAYEVNELEIMDQPLFEGDSRTHTVKAYKVDRNKWAAFLVPGEYQLNIILKNHQGSYKANFRRRTLVVGKQYTYKVTDVKATIDLSGRTEDYIIRSSGTYDFSTRESAFKGAIIVGKKSDRDYDVSINLHDIVIETEKENAIHFWGENSKFNVNLYGTYNRITAEMSAIMLEGNDGTVLTVSGEKEKLTRLDLINNLAMYFVRIFTEIVRGKSASVNVENLIMFGDTYVGSIAVDNTHETDPGSNVAKVCDNIKISNCDLMFGGYPGAALIGTGLSQLKKGWGWWRDLTTKCGRIEIKNSKIYPMGVVPAMYEGNPTTMPAYIGVGSVAGGMWGECGDISIENTTIKTSREVKIGKTIDSFATSGLVKVNGQDKVKNGTYVWSEGDNRTPQEVVADKAVAPSTRAVADDPYSQPALLTEED